MAGTFYRDKSQGVIAGVCAGLAAYFGVSVVLIRLIFLLLAFSGGPAVAAYLILWVILPEKATLSSPHETVRRNVQEIGSQARSVGQELRDVLGGRGEAQRAPSKRVLWLGAILIVIGLVSLADALHLLSWFRSDYLWAVALILAGVAMLSRAIKSK